MILCWYWRAEPVPKEVFTSHHQQEPEPPIKGRMDLPSKCCSRIKTHETRRWFFSRLLSLWELYPQFPVVSWEQRRSMWSLCYSQSALRCDVLCVFRRSSAHLSFHWSVFDSLLLLINSKQPDLSLLSSGINKAFAPRETAAHRIFSVF